MSYSLSSNVVPTINSFDEAERLYNNLREFPRRFRGTIGHYSDICEARPLDDTAREKGTRSLRMDANGNWCARYHDTDVVTFHPDGSISFVPWDSMSTNAFVNGLLTDFHAQFTDGRGYVLWVRAKRTTERVLDNGYMIDGEFIAFNDDDAEPRYVMRERYGYWSGDYQGYDINRGSRFAPDADGFFKPVEQVDAVRVPVLDQTLATTMRKTYGVADFFSWFAARSAMQPGFLDQTLADRDWDGVASHLKRGPDQYLQIAKTMNGHGYTYPARGHGRAKWTMAKFKRAVLARLYRETDCIGYETQPCYADFADFKRVRALQARYDD